MKRNRETGNSSEEPTSEKRPGSFLPSPRFISRSVVGWACQVLWDGPQVGGPMSPARGWPTSPVALRAVALHGRRVTLPVLPPAGVPPVGRSPLRAFPPFFLSYLIDIFSNKIIGEHKN